MPSRADGVRRIAGLAVLSLAIVACATTHAASDAPRRAGGARRLSDAFCRDRRCARRGDDPATESSNVTIADNLIIGSGYRGIDVVYASATVTGNQVHPAPGPYVIGIRVANAVSWPESVISHNRVEYANGYGIAVNFARVTVEGNSVVGGERAGIAINEMSVADVLGNTVHGAPRYGILVHDMSHAVVLNNVISGAAEPIKLTFHSTVDMSGNVTD